MGKFYTVRYLNDVIYIIMFLRRRITLTYTLSVKRLSPKHNTELVLILFS